MSPRWSAMMEEMFERKFYSSQKNIPCVTECCKQNLPLSLQPSVGGIVGAKRLQSSYSEGNAPG